MGLSELAIRIPDQLSVVGFDHEELAKFARPRLSVVVQPTETIAQRAVSLLVSRMKGNSSSTQQIHNIETVFEEGESVKNLLRDV